MRTDHSNTQEAKPFTQTGERKQTHKGRERKELRLILLKNDNQGPKHLERRKNSQGRVRDPSICMSKRKDKKEKIWRERKFDLKCLGSQLIEVKMHYSQIF